ncbi:MAG: hypothetical protein ACT4O9_13620 [Blastocatellia bacterium]
MQNSTAFKFAPVYSDEKRVDLSLRNAEAILQLSTWTDDLGWCPQKTISLDTEMLDELHRVITAAKLKLRRDAIDDGEGIIPAKILEFPKFA